MAPRPPPRSGTGYIGLDQWLALNQPQASAMADSLVGDINAKGQKAESDLADAQERYKYGVDSSAYNFNDDGLYTRDGSMVTGAVPDARKRAAAAQGWADAGWQGPGTLEEMASFGTGRTAASEAQRNAGLAGDFYGRTSLLQDKNGKGGGYTLGQQSLDSALVGAAGGEKIDAARAQWGGLLGKFNDASARAKDYSKSVQDQSTAAVGQQKDLAARMGAEAKKQRDEVKGIIRGEQKNESAQERADRLNRQREEREERKRIGRAEGASGGKARVDEWNGSYFT